MAAILKSSNHICSRTLSRIKLNLVGGTWVTWRVRIVKIVPLRWPWRPSWNSSNHISSKTLSWNMVGVIGATWRFRTAKIVPFHGGHLKNHQTTLLPNGKSDLGETWRKAFGETWRFRIAKIVPFWYQRWPPRHATATILKFFKNDISIVLFRYPSWPPWRPSWKS